MSRASIDFLRNRAYRTARRLHPTASPVPELHVSVEAGVMGGLSAELDGGPFTIGGRDDCDVLLVDDGVGERVVRIESQRSVLGPLVRVSSADPGVAANHAPVTVDGTWERLPCRITVGDIPVTLRPPNGRGTLAPITIAGLVSAGLVALVAVVAPPTMPSYAIETPEPPPVAARRAANAPDILSQRLDEAGLADHLSVSPTEEGGLEVVGTLSSARMSAWRELRMAWDARADLPPLMGRVEELRGLDALPAIAAIRLGAEAHILLADGNTVRPGDVLVDHWEVEEIADTSVRLVRDGERIEMTF